MKQIEDDPALLRRLHVHIRFLPGIDADIEGTRHGDDKDREDGHGHQQFQEGEAMFQGLRMDSGVSFYGVSGSKSRESPMVSMAISLAPASMGHCTVALILNRVNRLGLRAPVASAMGRISTAHW